MGPNEYALAGSHPQFRNWQREDWESRKGVRRLVSPGSARGLDPGTVHKIGTWREQPPELISMAECLAV